MSSFGRSDEAILPLQDYPIRLKYAQDSPCRQDSVCENLHKTCLIDPAVAKALFVIISTTLALLNFWVAKTRL